MYAKGQALRTGIHFFKRIGKLGSHIFMSLQRVAFCLYVKTSHIHMEISSAFKIKIQNKQSF